MKVWVVETGEYSSRFVDGVYSTEENAKIAAGDDSTVTEYEVDAGISPYQQGLRVFSIQMLKDGTVTKVYDSSGFMSDDANYFTFGIDVIPKDIGGRWVWNQIEGNVWAKDEQHAIKIMNEKRAQWIASGEWDRYQQERDAEHEAKLARRAREEEK